MAVKETMVTNERGQIVQTGQSEAMGVYGSRMLRVILRSAQVTDRVHYTSHISGKLSPSSDKQPSNMIPRPAPPSLNISAE